MGSGGGLQPLRNDRPGTGGVGTGIDRRGNRIGEDAGWRLARSYAADEACD